jgi:16S rRNA A1518/A1519 N6-dimethyltransferase RsmA/KsgA/DIM1 with predicted DNA glycosylase/AP lyase activity
LELQNVNQKNKKDLIEIINKQSYKLNQTQIPEIQEHVDKYPSYTFIEVCAGCGGLSAGLIKAGFTPLLLNDNNIDCCKTLKHNHPNTKVLCEDMGKIDYSEYIDKIDLIKLIYKKIEMKYLQISIILLHTRRVK